MAICKLCDEEYSDKRQAIGYATCLECGDVVASEETHRRMKCIAPAFNKGPYTYVATKEQAKEIGK